MDYVVGGAVALLILKDFVTPYLRKKMDRGEDADREVFAEVIRRVDANQSALAQNLKELWSLARDTEHRVIVMSVHHEHNHGQKIGGEG